MEYKKYLIVQYSTGIVMIKDPNHPTLLAAYGNVIAPQIYIDFTYPYY
jgi:hypothetical protein